MVRPFRKPLVVFTPKSLLRHPSCVSPLTDFTKGNFQEIIDDATVKAKDVKRVLLCSGKIYYDLLERRVKENREKDVAIIRLEQIFPLPVNQLEELKKKYNKVEEIYWVQEEPNNMGVWPYLVRKMRKENIEVISRRESSSTATGYNKQHLSQQDYILYKAFTNDKN